MPVDSVGEEEMFNLLRNLPRQVSIHMMASV